MRARVPLRLACLALLATLAITPARAGVRFGVEAGVNEAKLTADSEFDLTEPAFEPAWSAGVTLDVPVAPKLSIATGLRYIEYGQLTSISLVSIDGGGTFEFHSVWRYLAVPAQVRFHPFPARGLYLAAGPEVGYLLTVWHQEEYPSPPPIPLSRSPGAAAARPQGQIFEEVGTFSYDPTKAYERWNVALSGAVGCDVPLWGHAGRIETRWTQGLVDIAKSSAVERSTVGLELLFGMRW